MDKIVSRALRQRETWWNALKAGLRLKGYHYEKETGEYKYRFPAPGSMEQSEENRFMMYKQHYTTPFRDSDFNIRPKDKQPPTPVMKTSHRIDWTNLDDPDLIEVAKNPILDVEEELDDFFDEDDPQVLAGKIRAQFEEQTRSLVHIRDEYEKGVDPDYERTYNPVVEAWTGRVGLGYEHIPELKLMRIEMYKVLEERIVKKRRKEGVLRFHKGTTRRWMIGDDHIAEDQKQILQNAIQAPNPDDLREWEAQGKKPMQLPINNENVSKWRDKPLATDSADFSPTLIQYDMDRAKKSYFERFEEPKQLDSS